ncbi:MAG: cation-translocating P-type ATPase, partial [Burkholderiaceae bacterium]
MLDLRVRHPAPSKGSETPAPWHALSTPDCLARLASHAELGLTDTEADQRLARHGPNQLRPERAPSLLKRLAAPLADLSVLLLLAAALASVALGEWVDAGAIGLILLVNATVSIVQSWRADQALAALQRRAQTQARVIREGTEQVLPAQALVPGDVVLIEAGQQLPADVRWLDCAGLQVDESALTGESVTVSKQAEPELPEPTELADRSTLGHAGTHAAAGRGRGLVVATGMATALGQVAAMLKETQAPATELQLRLRRLARQIALGVMLLCLALLVAGLLRNQPLLPLLMFAVSLAVAAIPEALPAAMSLVLSLGAHRMAASQALVRRLSAMESLGSITVACTDKTGTLTANQLKVVQVWMAGTDGSGDAEPQGSAVAFWQALILNNDARLNDDAQPGQETQAGNGSEPHATTRTARGDPTEIALLQAAQDAGLNLADTQALWPRVDEWPFDAQRRCMSTLHAACQDSAGRWLQITKGAPEAVLAMCGEGPAEGLQEALQAASRLAAQGLRVLAVAQRVSDSKDRPEIQESGLTLLGLVALMDPPREGVPQAIAQCHAAGIVPIMITGDHPSTASAIAAAIGLADAGAPVLSGREMDGLSDAGLAQALEKVRVFARVSPEHKLRLVRALQARGERVAMTGDGINDAPALQQADVGVAMGRSGTDVAREAAALVLLDDHFATLVLAIREGRRIHANLKRFLCFVLSGNVIEILVIGAAPLAGMPPLLWPVQILWINLITDGLPGLALAAEKASPDLMRRPPDSPSEAILGSRFWKQVGLIGATGAAALLALQAWAMEHHTAQAGTMVFTALTLQQMVAVMALRSERQAIWA